MEKKLLFIIGPPRSGSTLLQRMLGAHSKIFTCPEPHILTPLAHLGYYHNVEKAPYDHLRGHDAIRHFVDNLPGKEIDYIAACQQYSNMLYSKRLQGSGKHFFLDKTPAYALVLDFISKLYPGAKYIVLTRHPVAVFSSYANSFFNGDYKSANTFNPIIDRYVPSIARFLKKACVDLIHTQYEKIVTDPEREIRQILDFLDLPFEKNTVEYGQQEYNEKGLGDPVSVNRHTRPMTGSLNKWAIELASDKCKLDLCRKIISMVSKEDLNLWGYDPDRMFDPVYSCQNNSSKIKKPPFDGFQLQRKVLLFLRHNIHKNTFGKIIKKIRFFCDILLR